MAFVPIRIDRTSKPPLGTPLRSDGHWSVQGLAGAFAANEAAGRAAFDGVSGRPSTIYGSVGSGRNADGLYFEEAFGSNLPIGDYDLTDNFAVMWAGTIDREVLSWYNTRVVSGYGSGVYSFILGPNASKAPYMLPRFTVYDTDGAALTALSSVALVTGTPAVLIGTFIGGYARIYINGKSVGTASKTNKLARSRPISIGADLKGEPSAASTTHALAIYKSIPANFDVPALSANIWQIYEPETVWVEVGGGAEIFSGTFSTYIGDLIQSGVGQIGCGGGITANAGSAIYSMGGLEGKQGDLSIGVSNLLQLLSGNSGNTANIQSTLNSLPFSLSGNSGNSANFNSQLITITQSLIGQQGISAALNAAIANLSAVFGEQVVFQGTVSAVTATFVSSISVNIGNVGQALASISVASVISGITGNIGLLQGPLNQISGQWIGNVGVSGSALMYVSTGTEMVGKLGLSASMASELIDIGAYLVEIVIGGKIDRIVISTKTGAAVILTTTGNINITTN